MATYSKTRDQRATKKRPFSLISLLPTCCHRVKETFFGVKRDRSVKQPPSSGSSCIKGHQRTTPKDQRGKDEKETPKESPKETPMSWFPFL